MAVQFNIKWLERKVLKPSATVKLHHTAFLIVLPIAIHTCGYFVLSLLDLDLLRELFLQESK
jgi:hypothetical protein